MRLISNARLLARLGLEDIGEQSTQLTTWIEVVSDMIGRYLDRTLATGTYTEYPSGGTNILLIKAWPITSITSIHESTAMPRVYGTGELVNSTYYTFDPDVGLIYRLTGTFSSGPRAVRVIYVGGYATTSGVTAVPTIIAQACEDQVVFFWKRREQMGVTTQALGDSSMVSEERWGLLKGVREMLRPYRRMTVG